MTPARVSSRPYLLTLIVWLVAALALGASGRLQELRPPVPQLVLVGLAAAVILGAVVGGNFRSWLFGLGYRQLVAFHLLRFVGAYFLVLYARGELPFAFAVPGGWGDIAVAVWAPVLVLLVPRLEAPTGAVAAWNAAGLRDILFTVATASRLAYANPDSMSPLLRLPLSLLPTFLVPLIIATHVIVFWRLWVERF